MGGKNDSPDFGNIAAAEGEFSRDTVRDQLYANRPTQYTPFGFTDWQANEVVDPATGKATTQWTQTQGLTPELQEILNKQIAMQGGKTDIAGGLYGRMAEEFGAEMNWDGLTPYQSTPQTQLTMPEGPLNDPYQTRQRAEDAVYNQAASRLAPRFDSQRQAMEIKLRNQGLSPGDEAYNAQMQGIDQQETDAYNQAMYSASAAGREEAGQMFGMDLSQNQNAYNQALGANSQNFGQNMQAANYANTIRQSQMAEEMQKRGFSLNEINALLTGQQVGMPSMPDFVQSGQAATPDFIGAASAEASVNNANNPWNAIIGAGADLGSAAIMR